MQSKFWLHAALVAIIAMAIYSPTLRYDFTYLDDNNLVLDQQEIISKPSGLYKVFGHSFFNDPSDAYYRPVVNLSFAVNALIDGVRPFGYHLVNCLLHAATCVLLLALLRGLGPARGRRFWPRSFLRSIRSTPQAWPGFPGVTTRFSDASPLPESSF